jgi:hypothetical protein
MRITIIMRTDPTSGATFFFQFLASSLVLAMLLCEVTASDHKNTAQGLPIQVEDAYPIKYRAVELQFATRLEEMRGEGFRGVFVPELKAGLLRNTQAWLGGTVLTERQYRENSAEFGFLYNFNTETWTVPAFAVAGKADFHAFGAPDVTARGIVTKSWRTNRFNLNADYTWIGEAEADQHEDRYKIGLAWDRSIRLDTLLLADIFTRRSKFRGQGAETVAEIGLRYQFDPDTVLTGGIGVGLSGGDDSRRFLATLGFSRSF